MLSWAIRTISFRLNRYRALTFYLTWVWVRNVAKEVSGKAAAERLAPGGGCRSQCAITLGQFEARDNDRQAQIVSDDSSRLVSLMTSLAVFPPGQLSRRTTIWLIRWRSSTQHRYARFARSSRTLTWRSRARWRLRNCTNVSINWLDARRLRLRMSWLFWRSWTSK